MEFPDTECCGCYEFTWFELCLANFKEEIVKSHFSCPVLALLARNIPMAIVNIYWIKLNIGLI